VGVCLEGEWCVGECGVVLLVSVSLGRKDPCTHILTRTQRAPAVMDSKPDAPLLAGNGMAWGLTPC
jgi:hypothetical protein